MLEDITHLFMATAVRSSCMSLILLWNSSFPKFNFSEIATASKLIYCSLTNALADFEIKKNKKINNSFVAVSRAGLVLL